uniref:Flavonol reductase/cinnamoyl coa reductase n=1 Tax=Rhipicephalus appendiculatus TaxID=34631 RepID=A0A131YH16_RHIAP
MWWRRTGILTVHRQTHVAKVARSPLPLLFVSCDSSARLPSLRSLAMAQDNGLVLVTGASGFIALHVVRALLKQGFRVRGTVRDAKNDRKTKPLRTCYPEAQHPVELAEADLLDDAGWADAVKGCQLVVHVASPFPNAEPNDPDDVIRPAVEGTRRVLKFAADAGTVRRVVLTSTMGAVHGEVDTPADREYDENDWTNVDFKGLETYAKSKTLAEKAAWDFVNALPAAKRFELVTVNPSLVFGPPLHGTYGTSIEVVKRLLDKSTPLIPYVNFAVCDVRDVAKAHVQALIVPEAAGQRHIINSGNVWLKDMAHMLREELSCQGYYIPFLSAPNIGLWLVGFIDRSAKMLYPRVGKVFKFSNKRMREVLKVEPRPIRESVLDTAHGLIQAGIIHEAPKYVRKELRLD